MKKRYCYWLVVWFTAVLASCMPEKDRLVKAWIYNDSRDKKEQLEDIYSYGGTMEYGFTAANFIDLQPDSTYTCYLGSFDSGKWFYKNGILILVNHSRQILELQVGELTHSCKAMRGILNPYAQPTGSR
jgi:hypothetical protein